MSTLGSRLRAARLAASLSQTELSERSGIPKPTLSRYENDHVAPSLATLQKLAYALRITQAMLLSDAPSADEVFIGLLHARGITFTSVAEAERAAMLCVDILSDGKRSSATH